MGAVTDRDTSYFNLFRIPEHALNLQLGYAFSSEFSINLQSRTVSDREEFIYGSTPLTLKGYTVLDLYAEYRIKAKGKLFVDLRNITNTHYTDWRGFNTRRFNFMVGVSWEI
jgi:vitamin B12 transporter